MITPDFDLPSARATMPALGQKRKWCHARVMSVLPLKADIRQREWHVRYVPKADICLSPASEAKEEARLLKPGFLFSVSGSALHGEGNFGVLVC